MSVTTEYYRHFRLYDARTGSIGELLPRGGVTLFVKQRPDVLPDQIELTIGSATCSLKDNYCRRTGRKIARQRIDSSLSFQEMIEPEQVSDEIAAFAWLAARDVYGDKMLNRVVLLSTGGER